MESYSKEFRGEVLAARDAGESTHDVALRFKVFKAWVRRIMQQRRETGQIAAKTTRKKRTPKWQAWAAWLLGKLDARRDIYLRELQADLYSELNEEASLGTLCAAPSFTSLNRSEVAPLFNAGACTVTPTVALAPGARSTGNTNRAGSLKASFEVA